MRRWKLCSILILVLALGALGCGGSSNSGVSIVISPTAVSVITNTTEPFSSLVTGSSNTSVTWTLACASGVTANTCGTIDTNGLYTAPATIPSETVSGTLTAEPTVTITATAAADTTKTATATVTIITGISISITPGFATVGTGETQTFIATVNNPGCNQNSNPNCLNVTWSTPTGVTGDGSIDANGVYTAPGTAPSPSVVTLTATSVADTTVTASASVTIVTATDPTVASVSPTKVALGSLFQDIYITGTNFISTTRVYVNGTPIDTTLVTDDSPSLIRARVKSDSLALIPPKSVLSITASQQNGSQQSCSDASQCQIVISGARPAIVGPSPDSIPQSTGGVQTFTVDGGYFGTATNPSVGVTYDGQARAAQITGTARQLTVSIGGSSNSQDFALAGLHQVTIRSNGDATKFAATNLAVQPDVNANPPTQIGAALPVGTRPSDVAINPATGMAVIANNGSNDVTLVDLSGATPSVIVPSLCTGVQNSSQAAPCPVATGPTSVAVAHLQSGKDIALVVNATTKTISEIDLNARSVIGVSQPLQDTPVAVGIDPVSGHALVTMNFKFYGLIMDTSVPVPVIISPVSISSGPNSHIAMEPHLSWAVATPGGGGALAIVNVNSHTTNNITSVSRTVNTVTGSMGTGVVTVTIQASTPQLPQQPLLLQQGDAVQIQNVSDNTFNGIYQVTQVGPGNTFQYSQVGATLQTVSSLPTSGTVSYSEPVSTPSTLGSSNAQGIAINPETDIAIIADPLPGDAVSFFNLANQTAASLTLMNTSNAAENGSSGSAFNPLTNTAYIINNHDNSLSVIDPTKPQRLPNQTMTYPTGTSPVGIAIDPASNRLIVANQGDNTVWVYSLGNINTIRPIAITESSPKVTVLNSTLTTAAAPSALTLTILGSGFSASTVARLDGTALSTTFVSNRNLTAVVPPSLLTTARRFSLDVIDSNGISNSTDFTVEQSIDVTAVCSTPLPSGVAIDAQQNIAAVSLEGCNALALVSLTTGTGQTVAVGVNPLGVAVIPRLHQAVVANNGSNNASIVDELGATVLNTASTDSGSQGAAADQDTGEVAIANSVANDVTVVNAATAGTNSITTDQFPFAVGFNYQNHQVAVATDGGTSSSAGSIDVADGAASSAPAAFFISQPTSVVYDPVTSAFGNDCGASTSAPNLVGCFIVNASSSNSVSVVDPVSHTQLPSFGVGVEPTSVAYNYLTSTLITTNTASHTVTVVDFLSKQVRAVLTLPPAPVNSLISKQSILQFAVDINPLTNIAVISDTANGRILFIPIPR